jgi:hypothetical protein
VSRIAITVAAIALAASPALAACGSHSGDPGSGGPDPRTLPPGAAPEIRPQDFVREVTNPWYPLRPGTTYRWEGTENGHSISDVLEVTDRTKVIQGVRTTELRDRFYTEGKLGEDTLDWYAQDRKGNVWYFGEATKNIDDEGNVKSTEGSWQAGVDGATAGIFMPGRPRIGQAFQQEHYAGHAEDRFRIRSLAATVRVPYVTSRRAMHTTETSPLEPGVVDGKYYVRGVGNVLEETVKGEDDERLALVSVTRR